MLKQGIDLRIERGTKFGPSLPDDPYGDLRIWMRTRGEVLVPMDLVYALVDFLAENELWREVHEGHWKTKGDTYFLRSVGTAWRDGWLSAADRLAEQRRRRAS